jgi:hypothetical protein
MGTGSEHLLELRALEKGRWWRLESMWSKGRGARNGWNGRREEREGRVGGGRGLFLENKNIGFSN